MNDRFEQLAQAVLDGTATTEQRAALDAEVARDAVARDRWESQRTAVDAIRQSPAMAPPPDLKNDVMRAIRKQRNAAQSKHGPIEWLRRAMGLRLVSAFAAGVAAGVLIWNLAGSVRGLGEGPVSGTFAPLSEVPVLDRASLATQAARAELQLVAIQGAIEVRAAGRANGTADLILSYDPPLRLAAIEPVEGEPRNVSFAPGRVALEFSGDLRCTIRFQGKHADQRSIRAMVRSSDGSAEEVLARRPDGPAR